MSKYTVNVDHYGVSISIGDKKFSVRDSATVDSISVDCGIDNTYICLSGLNNGHTTAKILDFAGIKGVSFGELASLIFILIILKTPSNLYLSKVGMDLGIRDCLIPKLTESKITLSKEGVLTYNNKVVV